MLFATTQFFLYIFFTSLESQTYISFLMAFRDFHEKKCWFIWDKLVRSVFFCAFISKQNEWTDQLKYSIAVYYFFLSLRQFSNSISKKWLVFGGDPILEPIFDFCERNGTGDLLHPSEQPVIRRSNVRRIRRVR